MWYIYIIKIKIHHIWEVSTVNKYGFLGFLSLLGLIGIFTDARSFLSFFAFAVDFSYFAVKPDEMFLEQMRKAAARAFFASMGVMGAVTLFQVFRTSPGQAMVDGVLWGWAASVACFALTGAYYSFKEGRGLERA